MKLISKAEVKPVVVSVEGAAAMLSCGKWKVWQLIKSGDLKSMSLGACRRVFISSINEYMRRSEIRCGGDAPSAA